MSVGWRKTKNGTWVVCGPVATVQPGASVNVTSKAGKTKLVSISEIGKPFETDDGLYVYGYVAEEAETSRSGSSSGSSSSLGECPGCDRNRKLVAEAEDSSGIVMRVCSSCARTPSYELSFY